MTTNRSRGFDRSAGTLAFLVASVLTLITITGPAFAILPPPPPPPGPPLPPPPIPPIPPLPGLPPLLPALSLGPPALPRIPSVPQVMPPNGPGRSGSTQLPATNATYDAKLLIVAGDGTEPVLGAIRQAADHEGIPYTLYISSKTPGGFTPAMLSDGSLHAFYQGIILTTGTLAYFNGTAWTSGFNTTEWQTLWDYQAKYRVRTAIGYVFPTVDYGYGPPTGMDTTNQPISARLSSTGQAAFNYVNTASPLVITRAWTYLAKPSGDGTNVLMSDTQGNALALVRTYPDGRQVMSMTFDGNFFLVHSLVLGHGLMSWVTGGVFLGERHTYISPQVDDIFIDDDMFGGGTYRINAVDWTATTEWVAERRLEWQTADLQIHMAFNGDGTTGKYALDTLTPTAGLTNIEFPWINHTFSHENLDSVSYDVAFREITRNNATASSLGLVHYDKTALVTPDVSGLKMASSMQAAWDAGVRYLVTDTSRPGYDNPTPQAGIFNPLQPGILMIPRRPVNLFYNVSTPIEWSNEYNSFYRSFWGRDLSYSEILDKESDVLLTYLLRGEADPWMFHQPNLRAYDGVHTLLGDLLDRTLGKYEGLVVLPVRSPSMVALGEWTKNRMTYNTAGVRCSFSPSARTMTLSASKAVTVPITGLCTASSENYGGQCIRHVPVGAGETVTLSLGGQAATSEEMSENAGVPGTAAPAVRYADGILSFTTTRGGALHGDLFDVGGRRIRELIRTGAAPAGRQEIRIAAGEGRQGGPGSGVYFYRFETPDGAVAGKLVILN